jgi:hypothetical protein
MFDLDWTDPLLYDLVISGGAVGWIGRDWLRGRVA